jgi:hypothetical protein
MDMKVQKIKPGFKIDVGDMLCHDSFMGKKWFRFEKVTEKFAFARLNDCCLLKFPRIVPEVGLRASGKRDIWSTVQYSAWRPKVEESSVLPEQSCNV